MRISTGISPIWRKYGLEEVEICKELKACGFDFLDYDFCVGNSERWLQAEVARWGGELRARLADEGITPVLAHVSGVNPLESAQNMEYVRQAVLCAGALGVENVVIPLGFKPDNIRKEYEEGNRQYIRLLLQAAEQANVTLLIEQGGAWHTPHYMHYAIEINRMMEKLGKPGRLKANVNVGNMGVGEVPPYTDLILLGKNIRNVDVSDNFGSMSLGVAADREDFGLAPMMGYINYDEVMQGLCDAGYDGYMNLRMNMPRVFEKSSPYYDEAKLAYMPKELTGRLLVWSRHIVEHMLRVYGCLNA